MQPPVSEVPEAFTPLEPNLPSPTLRFPHFEDNFSVVVGVPSSSQLTIVTPSVIVVAILSTTPPAPATLPVGGEDSLKFSCEGASSIGGSSSDGSPFESTPFATVYLVSSTGGHLLESPTQPALCCNR